MRWNCNWPEDTLKSLCHEVVKERRAMKNCKVVYCKYLQGTAFKNIFSFALWTLNIDKDCVRSTAGNVRMSTSISTVFSSNYSVQCSVFPGSGWRWDVVDIVGWRKYLYFSENIPGPGFQFQILINTVQGAARAASRERRACSLLSRCEAVLCSEPGPGASTNTFHVF